ncbi:hypothetical protein [Halopseudomonas sp.]
MFDFPGGMDNSTRWLLSVAEAVWIMRLGGMGPCRVWGARCVIAKRQ